ncbi:hypothetical protein PBY51_024426 [Eleginops maclovinus]|uniref:Uncharacterized protein n=1 Tax=Eleginops maclovinus TaxID=56733 RepID=A0AAN8ARM1_ELEMC|nr:hypothetical protein PBY51_024426 [Eleginops maclovinus]
MKREKKTRTVKLEKHEPDTFPMIVGKVKISMPKMRTVKSKEKIKVASNSISAKATTCETSGSKMKLCVDLMPVLAAAKENVEEHDEEEEEKKEEEKKAKHNSCMNQKDTETSSKDDSVEQTLDSFLGLHLDIDIEQSLNYCSVLPPVTQSKAAAEFCECQKISHTPLPPIRLSDQTRSISPYFTTKDCRGDGLVTGEEADCRTWMENPQVSKSRSPDFRLADISLSSLDTLLQTVTQKLKRKRRGGDEVPADHLLVAVREQHLKETSVPEGGDLAIMEAVASVGGYCLNRQRILPPLLSASTPMLRITMTKINFLTSTAQQ